MARQLLRLFDWKEYNRVAQATRVMVSNIAGMHASTDWHTLDVPEDHEPSTLVCWTDGSSMGFIDAFDAHECHSLYRGSAVSSLAPVYDLCFQGTVLTGWLSKDRTKFVVGDMMCLEGVDVRSWTYSKTLSVIDELCKRCPSLCIKPTVFLHHVPSEWTSQWCVHEHRKLRFGANEMVKRALLPPSIIVMIDPKTQECRFTHNGRTKVLDAATYQDPKKIVAKAGTFVAKLRKSELVIEAVANKDQAPTNYDAVQVLVDAMKLV